MRGILSQFARPEAHWRSRTIGWRSLFSDLARGVGRPRRLAENLVALGCDMIERRLVVVPISRCVNHYAFPYTVCNGWNYFVDLAREINALPRVAAEETRCFRFFQRVSASHYTDALSFHDPALMSTLPKIPYGSYPWGTLESEVIPNPRHFHDRRTQLSSHVCIWYDKGSRTRTALFAEYEKFRRMLDSLKHGYRPALSRGICPTVRLLVSISGDVRFLAEDGDHRLSVLAALGHENVCVRVAGSPVCESEVEEWAYVRGKLLSGADAARVFRLYFELTGTERAIAAGISPLYHSSGLSA